MFDELNKKEPEDIFSGVEKIAPGNLPAGTPVVSSVSSVGIPQKPQVLQPRHVQSPQSALPTGERVMLEEPKTSWVKLLVIIIVGVLVVASVGGWLLFRGYFLESQQNVKTTTGAEEQKKSETQGVQEVFPEPETEKGEDVITEQPEEVIEVIIDTDGDGLTDDEELMLGTDSSLFDTDGDQLSDKDEVKVYKTDPLNPDTDGDTYLDGEEVKNGYDPKGKGKLFEVPAPENQ